MYTQFAQKWLINQPQMEPVRREFLKKALRFYEEFAEQDGGTEPAVRLETARAYSRVAEIQQNMGHPPRPRRPSAKRPSDCEDWSWNSQAHPNTVRLSPTPSAIMAAALRYRSRRRGGEVHARQLISRSGSRPTFPPT